MLNLSKLYFKHCLLWYNYSPTLATYTNGFSIINLFAIEINIGAMHNFFGEPKVWNRTVGNRRKTLHMRHRATVTSTRDLLTGCADFHVGLPLSELVHWSCYIYGTSVKPCLKSNVLNEIFTSKVFCVCKHHCTSQAYSAVTACCNTVYTVQYNVLCTPQIYPVHNSIITAIIKHYLQRAFHMCKLSLSLTLNDMTFPFNLSEPITCPCSI